MRPGNFIVFRNPLFQKEIFVKKITAIEGGRYKVDSAVSWGSSSTHFGTIPKHLVLGKIIWNCLREMQENIVKALDEIRPFIAQHAGDVEFVKFENNVVYVKMLGTCGHCPLSQITLKMGIEELLKQRVEGVERVEAV